jgi:putative membrane protein
MPSRLARAALAAAALTLALAAPAPAARQTECGRGTGHAASAQDATWLTTGIQGDRFEITGGTAAQSKGATPAMKAFGARLVRDHRASLRDAVRAARRFGVDVPKTPSPSEEWELRTVGAFAGTAFDRSYSDLEVQDHIQDIQETKDEIADGCNATVRGLARDDLPVLRTHLRIAQQLKASGV